MIIAKIIGGLGNQLFQYAFAYAMYKQNLAELKLDASQYIHFPDRRFELAYFGLNNLASKNEIAAFFPQNWLEKTFRKGKFRLLKEKYFHFDPEILQNYGNENLYLEGYWQTYRYWQNYENEIRQIFTFKNSFEGRNAFFYQKIQETESVALHLRRGDYVQKPSVVQHYYQCSINYYEKAISEINQKVENPHFFVFSDDLEWCKTNLKLDFPHTYIDSGSNMGDLQLMSACRHQIIANSSFSWWGAWLNPNPQKILMIPPKWFQDEKIQTDDLFPFHAIKIQV